MPRRRTVDDDAILDATLRAVGAVGPARLTLADVAAEAGLAPATLVQRFGSKRGLLLAVSERSAARAGAGLRRAADGRRSALGALRAGLLADAGDVDDPRVFANHLAFLQLELADPEFHRHVRVHAERVAKEIRGLLDVAVARGELRDTDTAQLARTVQTAYNGALITWAIHRRGSLRRWVARELGAVLAPHAGTR
jgi:AcrR family transcriptional regulator